MAEQGRTETLRQLLGLGLFSLAGLVVGAMLKAGDNGAGDGVMRVSALLLVLALFGAGYELLRRDHT